MKNFIIITLYVIMSFCTTVSGDTISLLNINKDIDVKILSVTNESINAVILKKVLKSLSVQFLNDKSYPDAIFLNGIDTAVECKIKEITEDTVTVLIPTSIISSLQMSFQSYDKNRESKGVPVLNSSNPVEIQNKLKTTSVLTIEGEANDQIREDRRLEVEVPNDIPKGLVDSTLADEIRTSREKVNNNKRYRLKSKNKKSEHLSDEKSARSLLQEEPIGVESVTEEEELPEEDEEPSEINKLLEMDSQGNGVAKIIDKGMEKEELVIQDKNLGGVEGKILHSGRPLPDCQVRLQMLEKGGLLSKGYRPVEGAVAYETITDKEGIYRFTNVPPGLYKLYWKPHSEEVWVRRFKMEPDVIVESSKLTKPKVIETLKRTLN